LDTVVVYGPVTLKIDTPLPPSSVVRSLHSTLLLSSDPLKIEASNQPSILVSNASHYLKPIPVGTYLIKTAVYTTRGCSRRLIRVTVVP
jgi:hypothetical protein